MSSSSAKERSIPGPPSPRQITPRKPIALIVLLENVGHIAGMNLPAWAMNVVDWVTEEYAKILLRVYGAHRRYDRVVILEDEHANSSEFESALLSASATHRVDVLLLIHGQAGYLVGHRGEKLLGRPMFDRLRSIYRRSPSALDLRMVYGLNCHGATLAPVWLDLGAAVTNGAIGVNWFPEPSLSIFLRCWLNGQTYSEAVLAGNRRSNYVWRRILLARHEAAHPWIVSSRQTIHGSTDITISDV